MGQMRACLHSGYMSNESRAMSYRATYMPHPIAPHQPHGEAQPSGPSPPAARSRPPGGQGRCTLVPRYCRSPGHAFLDFMGWGGGRGLEATGPDLWVSGSIRENWRPRAAPGSGRSSAKRHLSSVSPAVNGHRHHWVGGSRRDIHPRKSEERCLPSATWAFSALSRPLSKGRMVWNPPALALPLAGARCPPASCHT